MTRKPKPNALSRRERQIMDILYKLERASVGHVLSNLADKPSYSTVRAQLRVLEEKGHVRHEEQGLRYVYVPAVPPPYAITFVQLLFSLSSCFLSSRCCFPRGTPPRSAAPPLCGAPRTRIQRVQTLTRFLPSLLRP